MIKDLILVVEDELSTRVLIEKILGNKYRVINASTIKSAKEKIEVFNPALIILDLYLPDGDGFELIHDLKVDDKKMNIPILLLTLEDKPEKKVLGFNLGIYDYMVKPFSHVELEARIKAHLNRSKLINKVEESPLFFGEFEVNDLERKIYFKHQEIKLTPFEYKIFCYFLKNNGKLVSRQDLAKFIWAKSFYQGRTIDRHISSLRRKLGVMSNLLETVNQYGYRFIITESHSHSKEASIV